MPIQPEQKQSKTAQSKTVRSQTVSFDAMFQHASLGILICNSEGAIEQVNPHANRIFGYQNDELIGQKVEVLIPQKIRKTHLDHRTRYNEAPKSRAMGMGMDLSALRKDGTEFSVEVSLAPYEVDGKKQIVSFISDITARKKTEEALKKLNATLEMKVAERTEALSQAIMELQHINENLKNEMEQRKKAEEEARQALQKEQELSELKSRFVSMASHEFRTPLSGILSSASLIEKYQTPADEAKCLKHLQTIKASVRNLTAILNDFLSVDKLDEGKVQCHPASFSLADFTREFAQDMQALAKKEQVILCEHKGEKVLVFMDQQLLRNVLMNLLSNAIKYSPEGENILLTSELNDSRIILTVQDKGMGIPKEDQKHLFDRFFRAKNVTATQGTGLGLNIVKKYLDLMGGEISFTSHENEGTVFTVILPRGITQN